MSRQIRVGKLLYYASTIRQLGHDPDEVIRKVGLDSAALAIPDNFISYSSYRQLLVEAAKVTRCERFGLIMSEKLGPQSLGVVGFSMQQAADLGTALAILSKFLHLHDQHGKITLDAQGQYFRISHHIDDLNAPGAIQAVDVSATLGHNLLETLLGKSICAVRYEFPYPRPADVTAYDFLQAQELLFDSASLGIVIEKRFLDVPIANHDPHMASLLNEYMDALNDRAGERITDKTEVIVKDMLSTGECTLVSVAELFNVTPRTLQNKLKYEGSGFHEIVEEARKSLALHYLRSSEMNLTHIALLIGYSDSSAFSRSFRRWYNATPSQWRKSSVISAEQASHTSH